LATEFKKKINKTKIKPSNPPPPLPTNKLYGPDVP
jgi:hypothetical protein